jgi:tetratricopeptide (TPR) repeat protein
MNRSKTALSIVALVTTCSMSGGANAADAVGSPGGKGEPSSASARHAAQETYKRGASAYSSGQYTEAIDLFRQADRLSPSAALSFNIARAYEKIGDGPSTLAWYRDYLRRSPRSPDAAEVGRSIDRLEAELAQKGVQQVTVLSTPNGATIVMDEQPVGVTPWTGELAPGSHGVSIRLRGYADVERTFVLSSADAMDINVALQPESASPSASSLASSGGVPSMPSDTEPSRRSRAARTWGIVSLSAGAAALGGAFAFEMMRRSSADDAKNEGEQLRAAQHLEDAESQATTARILAGAGAALAVTGGILLIVDAGKGSSSSAGLGPRMGLGCTGGFCGASAFGRFQ